MADLRWLEQRGRGWYCVQAVPRDLWRVMGRKRMVRSLGTRDLHTAIVRRHAALAEFQAAFQRAREPARQDAVVQSAMEWRTWFATADVPESERQHARWTLEDAAEDVQDQHGPDAARTFVGIAAGAATPLLLHMDAWLAEGGPRGKLSDHTVRQYRADLGRFEAWCRSAGVEPTIEAITRKVAGRFVAEEIVAKGVIWSTGNRTLSAPGSYWKWLIKRGHAEASPWQGQSLSKGRGEKRRRSMTDAELGALLRGAADQDSRDLITFAALTGARLSEIVGLHAGDCAGGWITIRAGKTAAAARRIPVHSALAPILARRSGGLGPDGRLFNGHAASASKRLGRLRQAAGVHERGEDRRQSAVTFHSIRHWTTTVMRNAGVDRLIVDILTGHKPAGETDGRYYGGATDELLIRAIESVKLPAG